MMAGSSHLPAPPLRFGVYELDTRAGELHKNGSKIKLQGQPMQVLQLLLENAGHVVKRDRLRRELWPAGTFVDFDQSINAAVKRLRDALQDSATAPRFIETLPRYGYRFIYPLDSGNETPSHEPFPERLASWPVTAAPKHIAIPIGTVARHFGISVDLLRLYEREGLLIPLRFHTSRRYFTTQDYPWIATLLCLLRKDRLNFVGIRRLLALIPCWQIRGCENHRKRGCHFIRNALDPCWMNKQSCCSDGQTCYTCLVYRSAPECQNLKPLLAYYRQ